MAHIMFDIDGTLIQSDDLDAECFVEAVKEVTKLSINTDWNAYEHVTDSGILREFFIDNNIKDTGFVTENIKRVFLTKIQSKVDKEPLKEILGASAFLKQLKTLDNVTISFATGGWYESAIMKLKSAGIDFSNIPLASSNDHYSRTEIMKIAEEMATGSMNLNFTYFGDGRWDLDACQKLGINFVLVGDKFKHSQSIKDFTLQDDALKYIALLASDIS